MKDYLNFEGLSHFFNKLIEKLNDKVDKVNGKGLSTNDYTTTEKDKLAGIATNAEVNQNAFSNVVVGSTTITADTKTDSLTIAAGTGISVSGDITNDKITITNSGVHSISTGSANGTISVITNGTSANVAVKGLGSAAYTASTAYDAAGTATTKANAALASAKEYADGIKNDLLNGAGTAYDTLKELGDLINDNTSAIDALETVAAGKADATHTHNYAGSSSVGGSATSSEKLATARIIELIGDTNGSISFDGSANVSVSTSVTSEHAITTAGSGSAYTATVPGITALTSGVSFIMIPHVVSASTSPTLDVNGLGAKGIKRRLSSISTAVQSGYNATWLAANKPFRVTYDGAQWIVEGQTKPVAADLYGTAPKATADASGNVITDTYATKTELNSLALTVTDDGNGNITISI